MSTSPQTGTTDPGATIPEAGRVVVDDAEVAALVARYLAASGAPDDVVAAVGPGSRLDELGLDSISLVEMLLITRAELTEQGRLPADATLDELPWMETVGDLGSLLRSLAA